MNTLQKTLLTGLAIAALQACTSAPLENSNLKAAQAEFQSALNTPAVPALAATELHDAGVTLDQAQAAWGAQGQTAEVDHLAYMASKKIAIAQTVASQRQAEQVVNNAQGQRQQTLLVARTLEAENAQRAAESAQRNAQDAQRDAAAQLQARLAELKANQTERGMVVTIGDMLFDNNSVVLKPSAGQSVQRLAAFLTAYPTRTVLIEGYTDSVGSPDRNQVLSERRASSVRQALLAVGVASDRMATRGYGEGYPVGSNLSADGRLSNRRVEVILSDDSGKTQAR
jgi:outer membrane protein OmpA-like peptidoglycan-associated protein